MEVKTRCDAGDDSSDGFETLQSNDYWLMEVVEWCFVAKQFGNRMMFGSIKVKIRCDASVDSSDGFEMVQSNLKVMMLQFTVLWARFRETNDL